MKYVTLVPKEFNDEYVKKERIKSDLNSFLMTLNVSENGKLIIQDIQFNDNVLNIFIGLRKWASLSNMIINFLKINQ